MSIVEKEIHELTDLQLRHRASELLMLAARAENVALSIEQDCTKPMGELGVDVNIAYFRETGKYFQREYEKYRSEWRKRMEAKGDKRDLQFCAKPREIHGKGATNE